MDKSGSASNSCTTDVESETETSNPNDELAWPFQYWCRTSQSTLQQAEEALLSNLECKYSTRYVNIGPIAGHDKDVKVWTWSSNEELSGDPLVLIHGFGTGLALWALNLDGLSKSTSRSVFAFDLPGFGRSSRPSYSQDATEAEQQLVDVIEAWRLKMGFDKMVLVGHSFGGFLSFSYSIKYPNRVLHLVCADPWGFNKKPEHLSDIERIPLHHRVIVHIMDRLPLYPLWAVRFLGPLGPRLIERIRADLIQNFMHFTTAANTKVSNYIFHCNVQNPTGESAFSVIMSSFGWAKNPMYLRLELLDPSVPLTLIYGSRSWVDHYPASEVVRRRSGSYVDFHSLDSGHHVYAGEVEKFNNILLNASNSSPTATVAETPSSSEEFQE